MFSNSGAADLEFGNYTSYTTYKEPSLQLKEPGWMTGLTGKATWNLSYGTFLSADGLVASGLGQYSSPSGKLNNTEFSIYEARVIAGQKFNFHLGSTPVFLKPYAGYGFRRLNDNGFYGVTEKNEWSYKRKQDYRYVPIGLSFGIPSQTNAWSIETNVEYDYFLEGRNKTYLKDLALFSSWPTAQEEVNLKLKQKKGKGIRASVKFTQNGILGFDQFSIEPFYKRWDADDSNTVIVTTSENITGYLEPKNSFEEIGIKFSAKFDGSFPYANSNALYFVAGLHATETNFANISQTGFSSEHKSASGSLGVGLNLTDQFALEVAYVDYDNIVNQSTDDIIPVSEDGGYTFDGKILYIKSNTLGSAKLKIRSSAMTLSGVAKQPLTEKLSLAGILGVSMSRSTATLEGSLTSGELEFMNKKLTPGEGKSVSLTRSRFTPFFGLGIAYGINERLSLRADVARHAVWFQNINLYSLKALYDF